MFLARAEPAALFAQHQTNFGALVDEMLDQRRRLDHAAFKANAKILVIDIFGQTRVQHDGGASLVFGGELAHGQTPRARRGFPINMTWFVTRLIVAQHQQIVSGAAPKRNRLSGVKGQQVQFVSDRLRFGIDDDVHVAGAQAAAMTKETEGKPGRKLEPDYPHLAAFRKHLFDALFGGGTMRDVNEVSQRAFLETRSPDFSFPPSAPSARRPTRFHHDRKGW